MADKNETEQKDLAFSEEDRQLLEDIAFVKLGLDPRTKEQELQEILDRAAQMSEEEKAVARKEFAQWQEEIAREEQGEDLTPEQQALLDKIRELLEDSPTSQKKAENWTDREAEREQEKDTNPDKTPPR